MRICPIDYDQDDLYYFERRIATAESEIGILLGDMRLSGGMVGLPTPNCFDKKAHIIGETPAHFLSVWPVDAGFGITGLLCLFDVERCPGFVIILLKSNFNFCCNELNSL